MTRLHGLAHLRQDQIDIDPENNARRTIYKKELEELCESIRQKGMLEPVGVRKIGEDRYKLVFGYRRMWCARTLEMPIISCVILDVGEAEAYEMMLAENLHREDVAPWDLGDATMILFKKGLSTTDIAQRLSLVTGRSHKLSRIHRLAMTTTSLIPELKEVWKRGSKDFDEQKAYELSQRTTDEQEQFLRDLVGSDEPENPFSKSSDNDPTKRRTVRRPTTRTLELAYQSLKQNDDDEHDDGYKSKVERDAVRSFLHWALGGRKKCPVKLRKKSAKPKETDA